MTDQELINKCESFTSEARTATTKSDLLAIASDAKEFYQTDWGKPYYDTGNWMSELDKRIRHISVCKNNKVLKGNDLSSFKDDLVNALSMLCGNFTYPLRNTAKS